MADGGELAKKRGFGEGFTQKEPGPCTICLAHSVLGFWVHVLWLKNITGIISMFEGRSAASLRRALATAARNVAAEAAGDQLRLRLVDVEVYYKARSAAETSAKFEVNRL